MAIKIENKYGTVILDNEVIAKLAGLSALKSYGIVGMASQNAKEGIFELLKMDYLTKGIAVKVDDDRIDIDLHVILEYGIQIEVVAQNIVDNIKYDIKTFTGLEVNNVNIIVQGIRID